MNTPKLFAFRLLMIVTSLLIISSCKRDAQICMPQELTDRNHLVDISVLNEAPQLLSILKKYPQLQIYSIQNDAYAYGMPCILQRIKSFTNDCSFSVGKIHLGFFAQELIVDTIPISLAPQINHEKAIQIAKQNMDFGHACINYRLGIYNIGETSNKPDTYKLVWKINCSGNGNPTVVLDAINAAVYYSFDGVYG